MIPTENRDNEGPFKASLFKGLLKGLLRTAKFLGLVVLIIVGLIPAGFFVASLIAVTSVPLTWVGQVAIMLVLTTTGLALLMALDWIRIKWATRSARRYLVSIPAMDFETFHAAFPFYDEAFLKEFRLTISEYFRIDEDKVSPEIDLSSMSPLQPLVPYLYSALFRRFCSKSLLNTTVEFPTDKVETLRDLVRETNTLARRSS